MPRRLFGRTATADATRVSPWLRAPRVKPKAKAPQADKIVSQRALPSQFAGIGRHLGQTGAPSLPNLGLGFQAGRGTRPGPVGLGTDIGAAPSTAPTQEPGFSAMMGYTPEPNLMSEPSPMSEEDGKKPFDWNRLAYVMGDIGQAAMGRFQDRWQAKMGGAVKKMSQAQAYQKAMARALSGDRLDPDEFTILSPEQRSEINILQTENETLKLKRIKDSQDYELKLMKQGLDETQVKEMTRQFDKRIGLEEREVELEEREAPLERQRKERMQEAAIESDDKRTKAMYKPREGTPKDKQDMINSIIDMLGDETKRRLAAAFPPGQLDPDTAAMSKAYMQIFMELAQPYVDRGDIPIVTEHGFIYIDEDPAGFGQDAIDELRERKARE